MSSKDFISGRLARVFAPVAQKMPASVRETLKLRTLAFLKIPLLYFVSPTVVELTDEHCVVKIPLTRRTRNHVGSMYFAALAAGADVAGGLIAWNLVSGNSKRGQKVNLLFKDFHAEFLKRAEGDVFFTCREGQAVRQMVERARETRERQSMPVHIEATVPSKSGTDPVAKFILTLSIKC